ncbi:MAG: adenosine kinase [Bermanella sp.]
MAKYQIYGIGNALVDKEFEVSDDFFAANGIEKGMMTLIEEDQQHSLLKVLKEQFGLKKRAGGGSAANTIFAAQYLGAKTFYSCNVANDESGDFYVKDLVAAGIDTNLGPNRPAGVTGKCLVMVTPDAERTMNTFLGITANLGQQQIDQQALKDSEYLYIEGYLVSSDPARAAAITCKKIAEEHAVKTAMTFSDPAMVQFFKDGLSEMIGDGVDLLFCNEEEALLFADTTDFAVAKAKLKTIAKSFAITLGDKGALLFDGEHEINIAPHAVTALDSNGAGDNFAGAFMYAITTGKSWQVAGQLASKISSEVVSKFGPRLAAADYTRIKAAIL